MNRRYRGDVAAAAFMFRVFRGSVCHRLHGQVGDDVCRIRLVLDHDRAAKRDAHLVGDQAG
jgi:hypothetical protein